MIKQKIIFSSILTLILTSVFSQSSVNQYDKDGERHGLWTKNYPDTDEKRYEGVFYHGKEVDTFNYYKLKSGKSVLSAIRVFNKDTDTIDVTFFTSKKRIISKGKMYKKLFVGEWIFYHKNSNTIMIKEYYNDKGQLNGMRKVFYKNGKLAESKRYKDDILNGEAKWFTESEKLLKHTNYKADKLDGKAIYYDSYGNITSEGNYIANKKQGIWNYYKSGQLTRKVDHTNQIVLFKKR